MLPDRIIAVISGGPYLEADLLENLDRSHCIIQGDINSTPPWMLVTDVEAIPAPVSELVAKTPVICLQLGSHPAEGMPAHTLSLPSRKQILKEITEAATRQYRDIAMAPSLGVILPDGHCSQSALLQALLGFAPHEWVIPSRKFQSAAQILRRHGSKCLVVQGSHPGTTRLE